MNNFRFAIPSVLDCETGEEVIASQFFESDEATIFAIRRQLEDAISHRRKPKYKCYYCQQLVKIRGKSNSEERIKKLHFSHQNNSDDCLIKSVQNLSKQEIQAIKYNGQKESDIHLKAKKEIAKFLELNYLLNKGVSEIAIESIKIDKTGCLNWRRPDISAIYKGGNLVFEIQLSTTFLSVIADREYFYKENKTFILWVFKYFSKDRNKQKFTEKDVFYSNCRNAFVFDDEAINESYRKNDLVLKCLYEEPYRIGQESKFKWSETLVSLEELTFDTKTYKVFYYDVDRKEFELQKLISGEVFKAEQSQKNYEQQVKNYNDKRIQGFSHARMVVREEILKLLTHSQGKSIFLNEFYNFSEDTYKTIYDLFSSEDNYQLTKIDRKFIKETFDRESKKRSHLERDDLMTCLCLSTCLSKLGDYKKIRKFKKVYGIVFAVLSIKLKCIIGQKFSKMIQVAHTVFPGEYAYLFIKMLEIYPNPFLEHQDISSGGKLNKKIEAFKKRNVISDTSYDDIFTILFPELYPI